MPTSQFMNASTMRIFYTSDRAPNSAANSLPGPFLVGEISLPRSSPISSQNTGFVFVFIVQERLLDAETDFLPQLREFEAVNRGQNP
jgi:hypothetical protein